jgi:hypothetical protein
MPLNTSNAGGGILDIAEFRRGLAADMQMMFMSKLKEHSLVNKIITRKETDGEYEIFPMYAASATPNYGGAIPTRGNITSYNQKIAVTQYKTAIPVTASELKFTRTPQTLADAIRMSLVEFWSEWEIKDAVCEMLTGTIINLKQPVSVNSYDNLPMVSATAGHVGEPATYTGNTLSGLGWAVPAIQKDVARAMGLYANMMKPSGLRFWNENTLNDPGLIIVCAASKAQALNEAVKIEWGVAAFQTGVPMNGSQTNYIKEVYKPEVYPVPDAYLNNSNGYYIIITNTGDRPKPIEILYNTKSLTGGEKYDIRVLNNKPTFNLMIPDPNDYLQRTQSIWDPTMEFWANPGVMNHYAVIYIDNTGL